MYVRFNTEDYPERARLHWTTDRAVLEVHDRSIDAREVDSVWWRRPLSRPVTKSGRPPEEAAWAAGEASTALEGYWSASQAHWVNHPSANASADCKPEQLRRAEDTGFRVPATLVTNHPQELQSFVAEHGQVITKCLREGRVPHPDQEQHFYTSRLSKSDVETLDDFGPEPYLFQVLIEKMYDVRVTVIGDAAYGCRIESQQLPGAAIDWRAGDVTEMPHRIESLPQELACACVSLTHSYGLRFSAIDLARRPDGEYVFFELNPNGQWAWVEQLTGLPLREKLADELLRASQA